MPVDRRPRRSITDRLAEWIGTSTVLGVDVQETRAQLRRRRVPVHWTNLFGVVAVACLAVLMVTGVVLLFFYTPSSEPVRYAGSYGPLRGSTVSKAFASTMHLSLEVRGGLLVRQAHHWAALLLPAALVLQLLVTFFTGAFRRPRRLAWVLLVLLFIVAIADGWSGYGLPDDLLAGSGLRIVEGTARAIPFVGSWLSSLLFGGEFPGQIIEHLYPLHVVVLPAALVLLVALGARAAWITKPAQFRGPGRTEDHVVGVRLVPNAAALAGGLFSATVGLILLVSATVTISPIWRYGPSSPSDATADSQPDWYTAFLDGALRLVPPGWEFVLLGRTWALAVLVPLAVVSAYLGVVLIYPFLEEWVTGDRSDHNLLDRPRDVPARTALGVAGMVVYGALWAAGSADIAALQLGLSIEGVIATLQIVLLVGPFVAFVVTRRICEQLQRKDRDVLLHGFETGRIVRLPGGEYIEAHRPVGNGWRVRHTPGAAPMPVPIRPNEDGRLRRLDRARGRLSAWYLADHAAPPPATESDGRPVLPAATRDEVGVRD